MFTPPTLPQPSESLLLAAELLQASNNQLNNLMKFRSEQFQRFWFKAKFQPRSPQEINQILEQMDAVSPGQSAFFFASAKALVDLIEGLAPGVLQPEDWYPRYEYTIDPVTYSLRVIVPPDPVDEPEEEPEEEEPEPDPDPELIEE
jgi:hypothetical protein